MFLFGVQCKALFSFGIIVVGFKTVLLKPVPATGSNGRSFPPEYS